MLRPRYSENVKFFGEKPIESLGKLPSLTNPKPAVMELKLNFGASLSMSPQRTVLMASTAGYGCKRSAVNLPLGLYGSR